MAEVKAREYERLALVESRDGKQGAQDFARRTFRQYREARKTDYGKVYRRELIESMMVFRRFLRAEQIDG